MHLLKKSVLGSIFLRRKGANCILLGGILLPNLLSALMEGMSYGFVLLGFSVISGEGRPDLSQVTLLAYIPLASWISHLPSSQLFAFFILGGVILQMFRSGLAYVGQWTTTVLAMRIQVDTQENVYRQILAWSFAYVNRYKVGELVEYANVPAIVIPKFIEALNRIIVSALAVVASIAIMFWLSASLTCFAFVLFSVSVLLQKAIVQKISRISQRFAAHMLDFTKNTVQSLSALRTIHTFSRQTVMLEKIRKTSRELASCTRQMNVWNTSIPAINEIMGVLAIGCFLVVGVQLVQRDVVVAPAVLLTFIAIAYRTNNRLQILLVGVSEIAVHWGQLVHLEKLFLTAGKEFAISKGKSLPIFGKEITFDNVSLQYPTTTNMAVDRLICTIPRCSMVAFVGASGAGKSSIMDLLLGLYLPTQGRILIDGVDMRDLDIQQWRNGLGVVSQDTCIFHDTIAENIRFGNLTASPQEVEDAARLADAHIFITALPEGYQTMVGERGYRLSGGERQRLALARALVRNPEILVLDEATSSLDSRSEQIIQHALMQFRGKKTIVLVAHRLSTVLAADTIVVMDKGQVLERGTHDELLALNGVYGSYWKIQSRSGPPFNRADAK